MPGLKAGSATLTGVSGLDSLLNFIQLWLIRKLHAYLK